MMTRMQWASKLSRAEEIDAAVDEALEGLAAEFRGREINLVLAFATGHHTAGAARISARVTRHAPGAVVLGCTAAGVIGGGEEVEGECALSITAASLPGVDINPFQLTAFNDRIDVAREHASAFIVLADGFSFPHYELVRWLDQAYPGSVTLGGLASAGLGPGGNRLIVGDVTSSRGLVGVALGGDLTLAPTLSLGCRPIGQPLFITRANPSDKAIVELDGRPVVEVLTRLYEDLDSRDRPLFERGLCIGLVMDDDKREYGPRDYLVRDIHRIDAAAGRIHVAGPVAKYQVVQFHLRDAATSTADLDQALAGCRTLEPRGGLLFSSVGRGQQLYGRRNHDSDMIRGRIGDVPLGGFFSAGEIGPVGARTFVHGYASVLGLFGQGATAHGSSRRGVSAAPP